MIALFLNAGNNRARHLIAEGHSIRNRVCQPAAIGYVPGNQVFNAQAAAEAAFLETIKGSVLNFLSAVADGARPRYSYST